LEAGRYLWEPVTAAHLTRAAAIDRQHAALNLGLVDCSVAAIAESLQASAILTLDVEHFSVCASKFQLEPGLD
jgi:predicted nucleic acid-binding protein